MMPSAMCAKGAKPLSLRSLRHGMTTAMIALNSPSTSRHAPAHLAQTLSTQTPHTQAH